MSQTRRFGLDLTRCTLVISLIALAAATVLRAQPRQVPRPIAPGTSAISGHVIDSMSKAPVAGCTLRTGASGTSTTLVSGQDGAYELKDVAADSYFFFVQCPAHLTTCPGSDNYNCLLVDVVRDQRREGVNFHVVPGATARGQVVAVDGRAIARAKVRLGRGMRGEPTVSNTPAMTDTEGRFELTNLPAGEWRLEVEIPAVAGGLTPPVVYYPGGLSWEEAVGVELAAGKVTDRLTITVPRINENTLTILVPPADATISDIAVSVLQESPLVTRQIDLNAEGVGTIKGILPGRYFVAARAASRDKQWAAFEVVDFIEDAYEARLQLMPTGSIAGKIVTDRGALPPLDGVIVGASWTHDGAEVNPLAADEATVAPDGSYRIDNLFGTRKLQLRALDLEWEIAAIRQDRTDVTSSGVIVVPDRTTTATIVLRRR
jgi:hypothetical protein